MAADRRTPGSFRSLSEPGAAAPRTVSFSRPSYRHSGVVAGMVEWCSVRPCCDPYLHSEDSHDGTERPSLPHRTTPAVERALEGAGPGCVRLVAACGAIRRDEGRGR